MKLSKLLRNRQHLLQQVHLANLAQAYDQLRRLAERVATVRLHGTVRLQSIDPSAERFWPALTALEGSQARLEEHFADGDLVQLVDAISLAIESDFEDLEFALGDLETQFLPRLRSALEEAGVSLDLEPEGRSKATAENSESEA